MKNNYAHLTILLSFLLFFACSSRDLSMNKNMQKEMKKVTVEKNEEYKETSYKVVLDECTISLTIYQTEINKGIIKNDNLCDIPLSEQVSYFTEILNKIIEENPDIIFHTFFYGRLSPDFNKNNLELSKRLALAAHTSLKWNNKTGRASEPYTNEVIREIANKKIIYPEIRSLFESLNFSAEISGVEKVLIKKAKELPYFDELKLEGVVSTERLPYDCITWFSIKKI